MTNFAKQALAAVALSAALFAGPASAITTGSLYLDVQSAISGSGNVNVTVSDDGVATLTGNTDYSSKYAAGRAALADPSVTSVINLISGG